MTGVLAPALILTRGEIRGLMTPADYLAAVEGGFAALARGQARVPAPLALELDGGGFHAKAASLELDRRYVALKFNGNFPANPRRSRLPTIQGVILLCDGDTGALLAILDSIEVTLRRTAAATALAARYLARPDSAAVLICGCGEQAPAQLDALREVLPIARGWCWDVDPARARRFAAKSGLEATEDLAAAASDSDVIVTCSTASAPFLSSGMVAPGTFIAAIGADHPDKNEIAPQLMAAARVVADSLEQCLAMGDLRHAVASQAMTAADVHAELAQLVAGTTRGRSTAAEITIFDSTGMAVQDVAAAALIYQRALAGACNRIALAA